MAERAAEGVAGAESVDDVDGDGRHLGGGAVAVHGEDALGALFDDGEFDAGVEEGAGAGVGSRRPVAISHSSRLPTATVVWRRASA
ncbi:hypothetical protein GCM10023237_63400 [Streptomyces coeruleoprunus]